MKAREVTTRDSVSWRGEPVKVVEVNPCACGCGVQIILANGEKMWCRPLDEVGP